MNKIMNHRDGALHDRQGLKLASYLHEGTADLPHDITERLRASREQALVLHRAARPEFVARPVAAGSTVLAGPADVDPMGRWARVGAALPLIALALGLLVINVMQNDDRARELADIDAALLTDELPPTAFTDRGFIEFLKENR
jgi:hypothetical protein